MAKRVTILDVAAEVGVSRQTVTRAMNGTGRISEATRQKVLDAAERLGYRASRFARSLVTREKTPAMGFVVASFRNPYYTDLAASLLEAGADRGWQIMVASTERGMDEALAMLAPQVDVIVGHLAGADAHLRRVCGGLPLVRLDAEFRSGSDSAPGVHAVGVDLKTGVEEAVGVLRERGAQTFGMVDSANYRRHFGGDTVSPRRRWFEDAVGDDLTGVIVGEESISGGGRAFAELMERHPGTDAVLMFNDLMALGAVQSAHHLGIEVPRHVSIVGVDGLALGEAVDPPLTSIAIDRSEFAGHVMDVVETLAKAEFARLEPIRRRAASRVLWRGSA
ncbi:LacI family DNA-binding transcriptional regulator [Glycomyces niveus]|uniref:LacI family DNA-binding transcriptional regulator n=1 Tax=Glycomyces niveus TaxID=2820287 RepID=A0ABS3U2N5_9ACTN|nr:LacI family DNA-binding transcriptional regulator [Glycomyces sp. NEAU-S30]MBO3733033.1 LacI family DNA-binding transcriptional regulator [Glycomyces sp. NEAU-S30]